VAGARLGDVRRFAVFDPASVTQITTCRVFFFACWRLAVLVGFLFDEACGFLNLTPAERELY
jgi:hypothetical protein